MVGDAAGGERGGPPNSWERRCWKGTPMRVPHLEEQDVRHTRHQDSIPPASPTQRDGFFLGKPTSLPFGVCFFGGAARLGSMGDTTIAPTAHGGHFWLGQGHGAELPPTLLHTMSPFIQPRAGRHPAPLIGIETGKRNTAGKEEEEEEEEQGIGREPGSLQRRFFSHAHNRCFPKGSSFLFLTCFSAEGPSTPAAPAMSPRLQRLRSVPQIWPAWEVWVSHCSKAKEAPHPFDYRGKLKQPNLDSLKLKGK